MSTRRSGGEREPGPKWSAMSNDCESEHCVTCSDEAVEVRVVELVEGGYARVDTGEGLETVSVALVDAGCGDLILVHAKEAIAVVAPRQGS
jgi:hypothetical protein